MPHFKIYGEIQSDFISDIVVYSVASPVAYLDVYRVEDLAAYLLFTLLFSAWLPSLHVLRLPWAPLRFPQVPR